MVRDGTFNLSRCASIIYRSRRAPYNIYLQIVTKKRQAGSLPDKSITF